ncbi:ABC transporter permease [Ornithinimicrobium humiphilum]|uniref:Transport permease protein n=1 Tax=Ornithinimicrobium humiphilum TaxID=125288 RepID=A0A543KNU7_9MICO|nr:ABC transporter permease [Ornithinimicrobium humiphilum]TQM96745.1 ABC-2 type transport system permease protein [Ornithinimicrobium humiphilum]
MTLSTTTTTATPKPARRAAPTAAVLRTEARLFGRELGSLFWILLFPVALLCILGAVPSFREPSADLGGLRVIDLYVPTMIVMSMIMAAIMSMPALIWAYREAGVLRRLRTTPVRPPSLLGAQVLLHGAAVTASSVLVLLVGRLVFDVPLPQALAAYAGAYLLGLLAAFSLGAVATAVAPNARAGTVLASILFFGSMFTAGVWFPVEGMGGALRTVVDLTPMGASVQAMTAALVGDLPQLRDVLVVLVWTVLTGAVSVRTFRWE